MAGNVDTSKKGTIHRYDLNTIKYEKLFEFDVNDNSTFFCTDEYIYYTQCDFHNNDSGYDQSIWAYDLKSEKSQKLFVFGDEKDSSLYGRSPRYIDEKGNMIFLKMPKNWEPFNWDKPQAIAFERAELKKGAKIETVAEINAIFEVYAYESLHCYDGGIIFQELAESTYISLDGHQFDYRLLNYSIRCVDFETGELKTLVENTTEGIDVAGDYLYYRSLAPEILEYGEDLQEIALSRGKFHQFNLKTGETKEFLMDESISLESIRFAYIRGRLFAYIRNYANKEMRGTPMEYDIATGKHRTIPKELIEPV